VGIGDATGFNEKYIYKPVGNFIDRLADFSVGQVALESLKSVLSVSAKSRPNYNDYYIDKNSSSF